MRKAALLYTLGRFGLFFVIAALLWTGAGAAGYDLNGLPLLLGSALLSSAIGYVLFSRQRKELAEALDAKRQAKTKEIADRRARLDAEQ